MRRTSTMIGSSSMSSRAASVRAGRAKSDSLLGDDIAPRRQPRRSIYDVEKTETQPLTGVQGQGRPGGRQGRRDPDHDRREVRRPPESDNEVEAAAAGGRAGGLRRGRQGQGGWTESRRAARQDR